MLLLHTPTMFQVAGRVVLHEVSQSRIYNAGPAMKRYVIHRRFGRGRKRSVFLRIACSPLHTYLMSRLVLLQGLDYRLKRPIVYRLRYRQDSALEA
jgi:hypothetical protein